MLKSFRSGVLFCSAVGVMMAGSWGRVFAQSADVAPTVVREAAEEQEVLFLLDDKESEASADGEYWLGIGLSPLPELARQQLGLEGGLVVEDVAAESPAAKAEIKRLDILIKAGEASLKEPADLVKSVEKIKGGVLTIIAVRGGKQITASVSPAKRPKAEDSADVLKSLRVRVPELGAEIEQVEAALAKLKAKTGGAGVNLFFPKPAMVAPRVDVKAVELPKNMTVKITKEGNLPAKVLVKKENQEWEVTEEKLSELPEDVRKHVQQYLNQPHNFQMHYKGQVGSVQMSPESPLEYKIVPPTRYTPARAATPAKPASPAGAYAPQVARVQSYRVEREDKAVESKLDAILKKLDQLQKEVDELRDRDGKK